MFRMLIFGRDIVQQAIVRAGRHRVGILYVDEQQLLGFCHTTTQLAAIALPGRDVSFVLGRIRPRQLVTNRPSYINAVLIQRAGTEVEGGCLLCRSRRTGMIPFPECRYLPSFFDNAYSNYK